MGNNITNATHRHPATDTYPRTHDAITAPGKISKNSLASPNTQSMFRFLPWQEIFCAFLKNQDPNTILMLRWFHAPQASLQHERPPPRHLTRGVRRGPVREPGRCPAECAARRDRRPAHSGRPHRQRRPHPFTAGGPLGLSVGSAEAGGPPTADRPPKSR